jgi:sugar phosphate isomerase/epimerase
MLNYAMDQITTQAWPFDEDLRRYQEMGIPAVAVRRAKMLAYGVEQAVRLLRDSGLAVSSMLSAGQFTLEDGERWPKQVENTLATLDLAHRAGAKCVLILTGPGGSLLPGEAEQRFLEILHDQLLPQAEQARIPLVLEPSSQLRADISYIHTHHDVFDLVDRVGSPHFKVCMEISTAWVERWLYEDIRDRADRIGVVQINDFKPGTRCTPERVPPGDGTIPLRRIIGALEAAGYGGYYDVELVGPEIDRMGPEEAVRRSVEWVRRQG